MVTILYLIIGLSMIVLDQVSKNWAAATLMQDGPMPIISGVFELHYAENRGVAFSMLQDQRWVFIPVSVIMTLFLLLLLLRSPMRKSKLFSFATVLVIAGAIGNLIDRILLGYVIDFLHFRLIDFPIFNIADCCVVVGAVLLFVYCIFGMNDLEDMPLRTLLLGIEKKESDHG